MEEQKQKLKILETLRHSASHLLAAAVLEMWPETKLGIGPAIENGFYYDFDFKEPITEADLPKIEEKMAEIKKRNLTITCREVLINEAKEIFKDQPFKLELINDLEKDEGIKKVSLYKLGSFEDLCRGPHLENSNLIGPFKLLSLAGAYWKGNEKNKMLTRIYGTSFSSQKELDSYLNFLKEAELRNHRKIGKDLDLFSINENVGPGLILWHPKLSATREVIEEYWRKEHRKRGYQYIYSPHIGLDNLWKTSGHLDFFEEGMYPPMLMESKDKKEKTRYFIKPMNCPFHILIYKNRPRSYRELPIRYCELGTVYRYEESGVLNGMLRVRGFTQDDAHLIVREDQFVEEVNKVLDFALELNKAFGFDKLKVYLSLRDPENKDKYVGSEENWQLAEKTLKEILEKRKVEYREDVGGAKFYGPAIDLKAVDSLGREWQGTTIQLDFNEPQKFEMTYIGKDGKEHAPIMLHRTLLGSMERFVATLIEQYAGAFPVWLAPVQVKVIPISEKNLEYGKKITEKMIEENIRVELDDRDERMQAKIRDAEHEKVPYMLIVGAKEERGNAVSVRMRGEKDLGPQAFSDFFKQISEDIDKKRQV
ncbi:threonine--tRNA ligase [Candidatus Microgenomates bacterium]|jgi:threonyl-tRNA synthetase|nr:MAG: threonine--tRNA ligase [Candidatus Microgenomates bacterium]